MKSNIVITILVLVLIVIGLNQCVWMIHTNDKLERLEARVALNSNSGQFDVGAFWGAKALELYIANKQQASYSDVIVQAKAMHSAATLQTIDTAIKAAKEKQGESLEPEKRGWWPWSRKVKKEEVKKTPAKKVESK